MYDKLICCTNSSSCAECPRFPVATRLNNCPLFKNISQSEFVELMNLSRQQIKHYPRGSMIAQADDSCNSLLVLLEGRVLGEMIDASGRSITIDEIAAPNTLASSFIFGGNNKFPVNITAKTDVQIVAFARNELLLMLQSNARFLENYLFILSNQSQFLAQKIHFLNFKTIKGKIASYLLKMEQNNEGMVNVPHTQQELADFFGIARQSLNRSLGELNEEGIIVHQRNKIQIVNKKKLLAYLDE